MIYETCFLWLPSEIFKRITCLFVWTWSIMITMFTLQVNLVMRNGQFSILLHKRLNMFYFLNFSWYPEIVNIFVNKSAFRHLKEDQVDSFYNSVSMLISNQVLPCRHLLVQSQQRKHENNKWNMFKVLSPDKISVR